MSPAVAAVPARPAPASVPPARPARLRPALGTDRVAREQARRSTAQATRRPTSGEREATAPSTRERLRAALGTAVDGSSPGRATPLVATTPSTRDRVAAGLREQSAREEAQGDGAQREGQQTEGQQREAAVVDLAERRAHARPTATPAVAAPTAPGGAPQPATVIPFPAAPERAAPQAATPRGAAPRAAVKAGGRAVAPPGRGPPARGPGSPRTPSPSPGPDPGATSTSPTAPAPQQHTATGEADPALVAFRESAEVFAARATAHQPGLPAARNAQSASAPDPERDVDSQAATARVEDMASRQPGEFDAETFKRAVREAVEAIAPPATLGEADRFEGSGRAGAAATIAQALVVQGQAASQRDIAASTVTPLDREGLQPKPVGRMVHDAAGPAPASIGAAGVLPGPRPDADLDLSAGPAGVDTTMAARSLTVEQLTAAHEPTFSAALAARRDVIEHAAAAPLDYRAEESRLLPAAAEQLRAEETTALTGMHGARVGALGAARAVKERTRADDQGRRDDVNKRILGIHGETKRAVEGLLRALDTSVPTMFTEGEQDARGIFERYVAVKMAEYKADRYGGWGGGALWLKDELFDLPDEVNRFYEKGRELYLFFLGRTIDAIASTIGITLALATAVIELGRLRVKHLVESLPTDLVRLGETTAAQLDSRFDLLASDVGAAKDRMVDTVARAYVDATGRLDARIVELQEANKGLATRAVEFVEDVADTVAGLGRLLGRVLLKAASVIGDILAHPIRFFGNLIDAVGEGLSLFSERVGRHLEDALVDLLFGHLSRSGIRLPSSLDYAGVFDLVCQVLGLTWTDIRARLVDRLGDAAVLRMEQAVDVFRVLATRGVGGLWELAVQRLADLPDRIIGVLRTYVVEQVIKTGLATIASLLTPASAFIKACQGIYRIVSFVVEKAREIAEFVDGVLDSIAAIANGDVRAAAERIDDALAGALKLTIAFLAKLARLDAVSDKVQTVITAVRTPLRNTVDSIVDAAVRVYRATLGRRRTDERITVADTARAPPPETDAHVIDVPVPLRGVTHHLRNDGPGGALELHSGRLLVNSIKNPVLQGLLAQYNAATTKVARKQLALDIAQWIAANMPATGPGGSAPGLGRTERHGSQPPRLEDQDVPLWSLRSEHVVPFAVVRGLWEALGVEAEAKRKDLRTEDASLTTIMIYKGAGELKDVGEASRRRGAAARLRTMTAAYVKRPDADTPAADAQFRQQVMVVLRGEQSWFAAFTWQQVQAEHATVSGGSTHGVLRAEATAVPPLGDIDRAAGQELDDAEQILDDALDDLRRP